jgi:hypothetical protein
MHRNGHRGCQGVRPSGSGVLRPTPEPHRRNPSRVPPEPRSRRHPLRRQLAPPVGGEQEQSGRDEIASSRGQTEEDLDNVRRKCRQIPTLGYGRRQHIPPRPGDLHHDSGHHLSRRGDAKVSCPQRREKIVASFAKSANSSSGNIFDQRQLLSICRTFKVKVARIK